MTTIIETKQTTPERYELDKPDPFDISRLYGKEKYTLCNMLIRQVNFPAYFHKGDLCHSVYSDRVCNTWYPAAKKYFEGLDVCFESSGAQVLTEANFLAFCREAIGYDGEITGARLIRYTNVSSGYPCYRVDIYRRGEGNPEVPVYSHMNAPNVNQPESRDELSDRYKPRFGWF